MTEQNQAGEVKRYDVKNGYTGGFMQERADGDYVRFEDYEILRDKAEKQLQASHAMIDVNESIRRELEQKLATLTSQRDEMRMAIEEAYHVLSINRNGDYMSDAVDKSLAKAYLAHVVSAALASRKGDVV